MSFSERLGREITSDGVLHRLGKGPWVDDIRTPLAGPPDEVATVLSLADAQARMDDWRKDYNEQRPHSALENRTPKEFAKIFSQASLGKS